MENGRLAKGVDAEKRAQNRLQNKDLRDDVLDPINKAPLKPLSTRFPLFCAC